MTFWQFAFKNVSRNSKAYFAYFVSSAFSIMVFFSFTEGVAKLINIQK
ncbi:hypothetical protein P4J17_22925 [Bacillus cereus]|nr:hypothetical protein [Bacillus thuringiensis]MEB9338701.1 hypothetical protein [Bacillus cereus]